MKFLLSLLLCTACTLTAAGCGTDDTCAGNNSCVCTADQDCNRTCDAGEACSVACNGAPSCDVDCKSSASCSVSCQSSKSCDVVCPATGCSVTCPSTGCTVTNCTDPATCRVSCGLTMVAAVYSGSTATCR